MKKIKVSSAAILLGSLMVNVCLQNLLPYNSKTRNTYRVSKTWTCFETDIIPLFINESFQNFLWLLQNDTPLLWGNSIHSISSTGNDIIMTSNYFYDTFFSSAMHC